MREFVHAYRGCYLNSHTLSDNSEIREKQTNKQLSGNSNSINNSIFAWWYFQLSTSILEQHCTMHIPRECVLHCRHFALLTAFAADHLARCEGVTVAANICRENWRRTRKIEYQYIRTSRESKRKGKRIKMNCKIESNTFVSSFAVSLNHFYISFIFLLCRHRCCCCCGSFILCYIQLCHCRSFKMQWSNKINKHSHIIFEAIFLFRTYVCKCVHACVW